MFNVSRASEDKTLGWGRHIFIATVAFQKSQRDELDAVEPRA
jgi:hypothetical protein